jgi:hypothetical protein
MYLIGREMNKRYAANEPTFLADTYKINDHWIQAQLSHKSIVGASAFMHGFYPPSTTKYTLNEW